MRASLSLAIAIAASASACGGGSEPTPLAASLSLSPTTIGTFFSRGSTQQLTVVAKDENDQTISNPALTFSTGDADVATVSSTGLITAQDDGQTTITARSGTVTAAVDVEVRRKVASVLVTPSTRTMRPDQTQLFAATPRDANNHPITGLTAEFRSSNESTVEVTTGGTATAIALGTATITAKVTTIDGVFEGTAAVTVADVPIFAGVTVGNNFFSPSSVEIGSGGTVTWTNNTGLDHNVTFGAGAPGSIGTWSSGARSLTFPSGGTFSYECTIHGSAMSGTVVVIP